MFESFHYQAYLFVYLKTFAITFNVGKSNNENRSSELIGMSPIIVENFVNGVLNV